MTLEIGKNSIFGVIFLFSKTRKSLENKGILSLVTKQSNKIPKRNAPLDYLGEIFGRMSLITLERMSLITRRYSGFGKYKIWENTWLVLFLDFIGFMAFVSDYKVSQKQIFIPFWGANHFWESFLGHSF